MRWRCLISTNNFFFLFLFVWFVYFVVEHFYRQ